MFKVRSIALTIATIFAAGCAGQSGGGGVVPSAPHAAAMRAGLAAVAVPLTFVLPKANSGVTPLLAKGVSLAFTGAGSLSQSFDVSGTSASCTTAAGGRTCTGTIKLVPGAYVAVVKFYNAAPVKGAIPSNATLLFDATLPYMVGSKPSFGVTVTGTIASLAMSGVPAQGTGGTPIAARALYVGAIDATGKFIAGPYNEPITLASSDKQGSVTIATSGAKKPPAGELLNSDDAATFAYSGLDVSPVTVSASAQGVKTVAQTFTPAVQPLGPALSQGVAVNAYGTSPSQAVTFAVTQTGWTNAPYKRTIGASLSSNCSVATVSPSSGTAFAVYLAQGPVSGTCTLTLTGGAGQTLQVPIGASQYAYTGSPQTFIVPQGVAVETVFANGGAGGPSNAYGQNTYRAAGGSVWATFAYAAGTSIDVEVGAGGVAATGPSAAAAYNGGAPGAFGDLCGSGGGGGGSDIRVGGTALANRVLVAGGGGGSSCGNANGNGGLGGSATAGGPGGDGGNGLSGAQGGKGGTANAGGAGGAASFCGGSSGTAGALGIGGAGSTAGDVSFAAGSGGGGYYGGGGGGTAGGSCGPFTAGGGGGSSYAAPSATNVRYQQGAWAGPNGTVTIAW